MKKALIITCVILLAFTSSAYAQDKAKLDDAYTKWKADVLAKRKGGLDRPHLALAIFSQRISNETARIKIGVTGNMLGCAFQMQPSQLHRGSTVEKEYEAVGDSTMFKADLSNSVARNGLAYEKEMIINAGAGADILEVRWTVIGTREDGIDSGTLTLFLKLNNDPNIGVLGVVLPMPEASASIYKKAGFNPQRGGGDCRRPCVEVTFADAGFPDICKGASACCKSISGTRFDATHCTVECIGNNQCVEPCYCS